MLYVRTQGLRELQRDLKRIAPEVAKGLRKDIRDIGRPVLAQARVNAPYLTGELSRSLRLSVTQRGISIYSTLPQAPVLHWGGTIRPRGTAIEFREDQFATRAVMMNAEPLVDDLGDTVERAARQLGWR
jgi:hypothetical protein